MGGTTGNLRGVELREGKGSPAPLSCHRISVPACGRLRHPVAKTDSWRLGGKGKGVLCFLKNHLSLPTSSHITLPAICVPQTYPHRGTWAVAILLQEPTSPLTTLWLAPSCQASDEVSPPQEVCQPPVASLCFAFCIVFTALNTIRNELAPPFVCLSGVSLTASGM